jgi:hypothetical protein
LEEEIFSFPKGKDDKVFIYWYNQQVMILKNKMAQKFIKQIEGLDDREKQLVMAKITGNFKRGNERKKSDS